MQLSLFIFLIFFSLLSIGILKKNKNDYSNERITVNYNEKKLFLNLKELNLFIQNNQYSNNIIEAISEMNSMNHPINKININSKGNISVDYSLYDDLISEDGRKKYVKAINKELHIGGLLNKTVGPYSPIGKLTNWTKNIYNEKTGPNKQIKSILNKNDTLNKEDYENLEKIVKDSEKLNKLTENTRDALEKQLMNDIEKLSYDNITNPTDTYNFLEEHAKTLGLETKYSDKKKTLVSEEIKDLDILNEYNPNKQNELKNLAKISKTVDISDELVEKYVQEYETKLKESDDKIGFIKELLENEDAQENNSIAQKIKEGIIEKEKEYLLNESLNNSEAIKKIDNILENTELFEKREQIVKELDLLVDSLGYESVKKLITKVSENDEKIFLDIINDSWSTEIFKRIDKVPSERQYISNIYPKLDVDIEDINNNSLKLGELMKNGIVDKNIYHAFIDFFNRMPSTDQLLKDKNILNILKQQYDKDNNQHVNDFADAIFDLVKFKSELTKIEATYKNGHTDAEINTLPELKTELGQLINDNFLKMDVITTDNGHEERDMSLKEVLNSSGPRYVPGQTFNGDLGDVSNIGRYEHTEKKSDNLKPTQIITTVREVYKNLSDPNNIGDKTKIILQQGLHTLQFIENKVGNLSKENNELLKNLEKLKLNE